MIKSSYYGVDPTPDLDAISERATSRLRSLDLGTGSSSRHQMKATSSTINLAALADDPDTVLLPKFHRYIGRHEPRLEDYNDRRHCFAFVFFFFFFFFFSEAQLFRLKELRSLF
jgi:hypothetical protein